MDQDAEKIFKASLVKNLQYLCAGCVNFQSNIEIFGHIFMRVDNSTKFNYFLDENIVKTELHGTLLSSRTFSAKPDPSDQLISNIFTGFPDEHVNTNKTNNTNLSSPEGEIQSKIMPVLQPVPVSGTVQMPVLGSGQEQLPGIVQVSLPVSVPEQVPVQLPGNVQVSVSGSETAQLPDSGILSVPDWTPAVKIQNVTSLAPSALQGQTKKDSGQVSKIYIQSAPRGAMSHGTGNVIQEQINQGKILPENTSQSASDILKGVKIKAEPMDDVECRASNHTTVPQLVSTSQIGQKNKRKTSHATRTELEPFIKKEAEPCRKKPRIIKPRPSPKPKPKPVVSDVDEGSQSSSGDFVDVQVHFGELTPETTTEEDEVFPVSMLKNLSGFEEACNQSVAILSKNQAMKKAFQDPKKRGTYNFYTEEEKQKAIFLAGQFGVTAICQRFGIPLSTLWTWKKTYDKTKNTDSQIENVKVEEGEEKFCIKNLNLRQILTGDDDTREVTTPSPSDSGTKT